ncbi:hypothetical protein JKF63_03222 [Porcisia hertigi]|uniref:Uncharacterized protein n=1 Tax=Porcisia hertigi TaxID=2761500 RepID=A0A836L7L8_9TRYP|nr:hypothetical protein JKF63_03222 [Porcisia hertigi]
MTVIGSPSLVDADDSDAHVQRLLARVRNLPGSDDYAASPYPSRGPTPRPVPSSVQAQQNRFRPNAAFATQSPPTSSSVTFPPQAILTTPTVAGKLRTATPPQHYPFEDGHNTVADVTASTGDGLHWHDRESPTKYSSALMQALSRTEGAAALKSPWTPVTQHGGSSAYSSDTDAAKWSSGDIPPDMYVEAMRAKVAKQQWIALEKARQEVLEEARRRRDCPFVPQVSPYAARMQRPASLRPENRFKAEVIRRKHWVAKRQEEEVERELQPCTFRPLTLRIAQLDPAAIKPPPAVTTVFHDLYAEAEDRRVFERDIKPQLLHQLEKHQRVSQRPMAPTELAAVVERLCARGVVRSGNGVGASPTKGKADGVPYGDDAQSAECAVSNGEVRRPMLSLETKRIVAAQIAAGERDGDIVRQLYRNTDEGFAQVQLKREIEEEHERLAHAERATALAHERKRLQQEHHRVVLVAKFRALAQHVAGAQTRTHRGTAPQSVVQLARASLDILSAEEAEELLGAMEYCGRQKLTEREFVVVVFRYLAEQQVTPAQSALLRTAPPPPLSTRRAASATTLKRAGRASGIADKVEDLSPGFPHVKREKVDPEVIEQVRARRAAELREWKQENERRRAIRDGILTEDSECTFQPAPRRLIPYECRPDVTVPVRSTKSEELRRTYVGARMQGAAPPLAVAPMTPPVSTQTFPASRVTARELFSRGPSDPIRPRTHARSRSAAARSVPSTQPEGGAAALTSTTSVPVTATSPVVRPCQPPEDAGALSVLPARKAAPTELEPRSGSHAAALGGSPTPSLGRDASTSPAPEMTKKVQSNQLAPHPRSACPCHSPATSFPASFLIHQITHCTPEERTRLGRELLLRQMRELQRRSGA